MSIMHDGDDYYEFYFFGLALYIVTRSYVLRCCYEIKRMVNHGKHHDQRQEDRR
jgi:hypothetical protein